MWVNIQRNYLPILSGLIFVFIVGVVVVEIDRQVYQDKKKEICIREWTRICPKSLVESLDSSAAEYFRDVHEAHTSPNAPALLRSANEARRAMEGETSRILHADNCLIGISVIAVTSRTGELVRETVVSRHVDKYRRQNTFANSLVLRRFWGETAMTYHSKEPPNELIGEVVFRYTTPSDIPEIRKLTTRFRFYLAGVVLSLGLLYWYILRHLIMPIKVVTSCIDRSKEALPEILPHPRTILEAAYNDLAREALLNSVTRAMAEYMSLDRLVSRDEILAGLPDLIAPKFGFAAVYLVELTVGEGPVSAVCRCRAAFFDKDSDRLPKPTDADWIALAREFNRDWSDRALEFAVGNHAKGRPYFAVPIVADREQRHVTFLAATPRGSLAQENVRWHRETLLRLANAVRAGLETLEMQRDLIAREKSEANISLSRALGHDLTNVIATSKLELDTVRRFLSLPPDRQAQPEPPLRHLFTESLEGLLNNTKFLQEIINIYRSFSYVHHPQYELADLDGLLDEVVGLFQLSLSRQIRIQRSYGGDVPRTCVEPRLLKLAVFNLLTNATDALKRRAMTEGDFGASLWISTAYDPASKTITVSVRDNGHGIRNQSGELASPDEVRQIFRGGFTTKRHGMAEGLGLNWVRQIVLEFHRGQLRARNHPEGGAEVSLLLPHVEVPPGRGGSGGAADEALAAAAGEDPMAEGESL